MQGALGMNRKGIRMTIILANYEEIKVGDKASTTRTVTEEDVQTFAELSGDFNPLHMVGVRGAATYLR